ncbi:MAG: VWA domain-containing protein [Gemmatimonadota bacterium]|jgi:Ca-activated chloride channel family protein|nr:VWA domain-containing protein [Gemmatimonadota bacterium]
MGGNPVTFTRPELLWAGGAAALLAVLGLWGNLRRRRRLARFMGGRAAAGRLSPSNLWRFRWERLILLSGTALALGVAAAEPVVPVVPEAPPVRVEQQLMIALDVSASMQASDLSPTRLAAAVEAARRLIAIDEDQKVGLLLFAGEPYLLSPPTDDQMAIDYLLSGVTPTIASAYDPGTRLVAALEAAADVLRNPSADGLPAEVGEALNSGVREAGAQQELVRSVRSVLVVTDGDSDESESRLVAAAGALAEDGITVHFATVGTKRGGTMVMPRGQYQIGGVINGPNGSPVISRARPELLAAAALAGKGIHLELPSDDPDALARSLLAAKDGSHAQPEAHEDQASGDDADALPGAEGIELREGPAEPRPGFPGRWGDLLVAAVRELDPVGRLVAAAAVALLLESLMDVRRPRLLRVPGRRAS